jgi:hypothetical protein
MNRTHPSWLESALLRLVAADNEPLAGDLVEELRAGRSRRWFWGQLARGAIVAVLRRREAVPAGLQLVAKPAVPMTRSLEPLGPGTMTGLRVQGIGGLGMIAVVVLVTLAMPAAWWLAAMGCASGIALGVFWIVRRRRRGFASGDADSPMTVFGSAGAR